VILKIPTERMKVASGSTHIVWFGCRIQSSKQGSQPRCVLRSDTRLRAILSEPLQTFMAVTLDHRYSVYTHYTKVKE
jgi:hypothetical protein